MEAANIEAPLRERELVGLHALAREIPNIDAAVAEIARFSAELTFVRVQGRDFEEIWSSLARFSFLAIVPQSSSSSYSIAVGRQSSRTVRPLQGPFGGKIIPG